MSQPTQQKNSFPVGNKQTILKTGVLCHVFLLTGVDFPHQKSPTGRTGRAYFNHA